MNYLYELKVYGGEYGDIELCRMQAFSQESLIEHLGKVDKVIEEYESRQEVREQMEIERQKDEEPENDFTGATEGER